jgi:NitT/TauT family transport system permease protein
MQDKIKKRLKGAAITVAALLFWILVWFLAAKKVNVPFVLPSPAPVFYRLFQLMGTSAFYATLFISFLRVITGFFAGLIFGFFLGHLSHFLTPIKVLISPLMAIVRATPVASFILVVLFWMEKEEVPAFISFLMVLPIVWQNTVLGLETRDPALVEMAKVYQIPVSVRFFKIDLPHVMKYVVSAGKTGLGLAWKAGVAAEVLALPKASVGYMIYNAKMYLEQVDLYAWTVAIIGFSVILEKLFLSILETGRKRNADSKEAL